MRKMYVLGFAAAAMLTLGSCGPKRYGCNKRRCIVTVPVTTGQATAAAIPTQNA